MKGPTLARAASTAPLRGFDLHAKVGVLFSQTDLQIGRAKGGLDSVSTSASSNPAFAAIGVGYVIDVREERSPICGRYCPAYETPSFADLSAN